MNKFTIKNLDLYYGDAHTLKNITMDIEANKNHCIDLTFRLWEIHPG